MNIYPPRGVTVGNHNTLHLVKILGENGLHGEVGKSECVVVLEGEHTQVVQAKRKEGLFEELSHIEFAL